MFGYVQPLKCELKLREYDYFQALYCGLCHELGRRYGMLPRLLLNYDFTFLAALLVGISGGGEYVSRRCVSRCAGKKQCVCVREEAFAAAADFCVVLHWHRLRDEVSDRGLLGGIPYRLLALAFGRARRKAAGLRPEFDRFTSEMMSELSALERKRCPSIDMPADKFALILKACAGSVGDEKARLPLETLLYHVGRWIYLIDACDDLADDLAGGSYNPVALRFGLTSPEIAEEDVERLRATLFNSLAVAASAAELLSLTKADGVVKNIIYLGLPAITKQVLASIRSRKKPVRRIKI